MKRSFLALLLVFCLLLCAIPLSGSADAAYTCFLAVNDDLLPLDTMPYVTPTASYAPASVFTRFHIYYSYFQDGTALLYTADKQLFFDLNAGTVYDGAGNTYADPAMRRNGVVYLPVSLVCSFFGTLSASFIYGNSYGDILRITDGTQVLSDRNLLSAASLLMRSYYNAYYGVTPTRQPNVTPAPTREPEVSPSETVSPSGEPDADDNVSPSPEPVDAAVQLSFVGVPEQLVLDCLNTYNLRACFFLTETDIRENPDLLRGLTAAGHRVGIYCGSQPEEEYAVCAPLLYECTRETAMFVTSDAENRSAVSAFAGESLPVYCSFDAVSDETTTAAQLTEVIRSSRAKEVSLCFAQEKNTASLVSALCRFIRTNEITVPPAMEIDSTRK